MSITKLSHRAEMAYGTVRKLYYNPYAEVTLTTLRRLAEVLGVPTADLIEDVPNEQED